GLIGAAWYLAYYAHFAQGGAEAVALGGLTGPFAIVHSRTTYRQAWFDETGGVYPAFHVIRGLSRLGGANLTRLEIAAPREVQGLAVERGGKREITALTLADVVSPERPKGFGGKIETAVVDLSAHGAAEGLVASRPDIVVHLAAIVSGEAEADFERGYRINLDGTRALFEAI